MAKRGKPYCRRITVPKGAQPRRCAYCRWPRYEGQMAYQRIDGPEVFCSTVCGRFYREKEAHSGKDDHLQMRP